MGGTLPSRRPPSHVRRTTVKRSSPGLRFVQIVAIGLIAVFASGIFAVGISPSFAVRTIRIQGVTFTSESIVRSILGMDDVPNAFRVDTDSASARLVRLPAVESARVQVQLPSTVVVTIVERQPRLVWVIGDRRFVVDENGLLFGLVDAAGNPIPSDAGPLPLPGDEPSVGPSVAPSQSVVPTARTEAQPTETPAPTPTPTPAKTAKGKATAKPSPGKKGATPVPSAKVSAGTSPKATLNPSMIPSIRPVPTLDGTVESGPHALSLPVVLDRRAADAGLGLGGVVDAVSLDAGFRLANLDPTEIASKAIRLAVVLDDDHGFTVSSIPAGWVADFGFYTPTARKDTVIPNQVRDLKSALLNWGENKVAWVFLVSDVSDNHNDTVILR